MLRTIIQSIQNISLSRRLLIAFVVAVIIPCITLIFLGSFYWQMLNARLSAAQLAMQVREKVTDQRTILQNLDNLIQLHFAQTFSHDGTVFTNQSSTTSSQPDIEKEIRNSILAFDKNLALYVSNFDFASADKMASIRDILIAEDGKDGQPATYTALLNAHKKALQAIEKGQWDDYKEGLDTVLQMLHPTRGQDQPSYTSSIVALRSALDRYTRLRGSWDTIVNTTTRMSATLTHVTDALIFPLYVAIIIALLLMGGIGYLFMVTIIQPLKALATLTRRIANGETAVRADVVGKDEIAQIAFSLNSMLDYIVRLLQDAQEKQAVLRSHIEKLGNEVSVLGEGDLRVQAVSRSELGILADSFNYVTDELNNLLLRVKSLVHDIRNAMGESVGYMTGLLAYAGAQLEQIGLATLEVGKVEISSHKVAERTSILHAATCEARRSTKEGKAAVKEAISDIRGVKKQVRVASERFQSLETRFHEMSTIVKGLVTISQQTNHLALDAAIQAAMAGEHGKGFAAVITDIRRLSERTREQAMIMNQLMHDMVDDINNAIVSMRGTEQKVGTGTQQVQEVSNTFTALFDVVERQAGEIDVIRQMVMQQLASSHSVVQIIRTISEETQQRRDSIGSAIEEMERLVLLAELLQTSVEVFKIREEKSAPEPEPVPPSEKKFLKNIPPVASKSISRNDQVKNEISAVAQSVAPEPVRQYGGRVLQIVEEGGERPAWDEEYWGF